MTAMKSALQTLFKKPLGTVLAAAMLVLIAGATVPAAAASLHAAQNKNGPTLNIPGLPPIQLPPGTQVFGPNGPKSNAKKPAEKGKQSPRGTLNSIAPKTGENSKNAAGTQNKSKKQEAKKAKPKGRDAVLADLFNRLAKSKTRAEARGIVRLIQQVWLRSGSDTADLLMGRALKAVRKKNYKLALRLFDKMVLLEPRWAEVWHQRATARYNSNDPDGAVSDIARTLALETRHFSALVGLGFILRAGKQEKQALRVFRRALELNPHLKNVKKTIEKLEFAVEGQKI